MKNNKYQICPKVQIIDQKSNSKFLKTRKNDKKDNLISMMAFCQKCLNQTTRKNMQGNIYVCDNCKSNTQNIEQEINESSPRYIDWDYEIDYLYYHFWLNE